MQRMAAAGRRIRKARLAAALLCATFCLLYGCSESRPPPRAAPIVELVPEPTAAPEQEPSDGARRERGWLGVELADAPPATAGVLVRGVVPKSPAERAGLSAGDLIVAIDGERVDQPSAVVALIAQRWAGKRVSVLAQRGEATRLLAVELEPLPAQDEIMKMSYVGAPAPGFDALKTVQGAAPAKLADAKGKVVVLEFWATWCAVCRMLVPTMNDWHARYAAQGVTVLGVTSENVLLASQGATQLGMTYPLASDESGEMTRAYRALALPTVFVIDRTGTVRDVMVGYSSPRLAELERLIGELLAQN
jgi:peroxiredoxin